MTCFKPTLALSAISLLLAGCGGSDSSAVSGTTQIKLVVQSIEDIQYQTDTGERVARQVDGKEYQHLLITDGYEIEVDEGSDGGESYTINNQSFDFEGDNTISLSVTGKATVTLSHPFIPNTHKAYTVTSVEKQKCTADDTKECHTKYAVPISNKESITSIYLANSQWNYVTVSDSSIYYDKGDLIAPPKLGDSEMNKSTTPIDGKHYWFGYASNDTDMQLATTEGFYVIPVRMNDQRNRHQAVIQSTNAEGEIVFLAPAVDGMGDIPPITPQQRYESVSTPSNDEYSCRQAGGTHYSLEAYRINDTACLVPSISAEAKTLSQWQQNTYTAFFPLPNNPTIYYQDLTNRYDSKQICHNFATNGDHPETYQRAAYSYYSLDINSSLSCLAEVIDKTNYDKDEAAFFSIELLNQEIENLQFFDIQPHVKLDSLSGIHCDRFTSSQVDNCSIVIDEGYGYFDGLHFKVNHNDIILPLKSFSGSEKLSDLNAFGILRGIGDNVPSSSVFYQFSIQSPDMSTKYQVKILPSARKYLHHAYVYDGKFELIESYTNLNSIMDFYYIYRNFTLVRNTEKPDHSLELRIKNMKGTTVHAQGFDFSFHDTLQ